MSTEFELKSCFYCGTGHILKKLLMQSGAFLSNIYFHQQVLVELNLDLDLSHGCYGTLL